MKVLKKEEENNINLCSNKKQLRTEKKNKKIKNLTIEVIAEILYRRYGLN